MEILSIDVKSKPIWDVVVKEVKACVIVCVWPLAAYILTSEIYVHADDSV